MTVHVKENTDVEYPDTPNTNYTAPEVVPMTNPSHRHCEETFLTKRELLSHLTGHTEMNPLVQDWQMRSPSQKRLAVHEKPGVNIISLDEEPVPNYCEHSREIVMNLDKVCEGQKMKFSIPGISKAVTVNFSVKALQEMKNVVLNQNNPD